MCYYATLFNTQPSTQPPPGRTQVPSQPKSTPSPTPSPALQIPASQGGAQSHQQETTKQPQPTAADIYRASPSRPPASRRAAPGGGARTLH